MPQTVTLRLLPAQAHDSTAISDAIAQQLGIHNLAVNGFYKTHQSIDARSRQQIWYNVTVQAFINEPFHERPFTAVQYPNVSRTKHRVIVVGAGPAGLFAALKLIRLGIQPIVLERGKDVRARRRDLAHMNKTGEVHPESNYCFGEGGAGTYSDGKLYTRSNKRGSINEILNVFVQFGADEKILYESHPHIGTNKLPHIITAMREQIIAAGGQVLFEKKLVDVTVQNNNISTVITADGDSLTANAVLLATGHSARDIFELFYRKGILIEAKPFALGVRVEHPQHLIDSIQYHCPIRGEYLPPASYSLVHQSMGRGVFSFCMCPGGIIAPAATAPGELVVNGWSPSKRNNPYSNSGMVVSVELADVVQPKQAITPLSLLAFQQSIEQQAFKVGGGTLAAPTQRLVDFCNYKISNNLPDCSYIPGVTSANLRDVLPAFIHERLREGLIAFGTKMKGYYTNEAVLVATESRTSSPVRIPRDTNTFQHPQIQNLYPCGEGAGYAGGIVSAAMDGEKVAAAIALQLSSKY